MIAMQYSIALPADYDMDIIRRRIAERGHMTDHFPHLGFKAYAYASRDEGEQHNLYAPFYLWASSDGMNAFLGGPGFAGLCQSFGRPTITTWSVWHAQMPLGISDAKFAVRETMPIPNRHTLSELLDEAKRQLMHDRESPISLGGMVAYEPATWTLVRFSLYAQEPTKAIGDNAQHYRIGHMSLNDQ